MTRSRRVRKQRRDREKEIEAKGEDTPYPGWDEIGRETREEAPAILLTVRDASGAVVRRLTGPVEAGFHRVAWDLRYPSPEPWKPKGEASDRWKDTRGFLAAPGIYTVSLARRVDGTVTDLGKRRMFEVAPLRKGTLPGASPDEVAAFSRELSEMERVARGARSAIDDALKTRRQYQNGAGSIDGG